VSNLEPARPDLELPPDPGQFGIPLLHRYWQNAAAPRTDRLPWDLQNTLLSGLGLNLLETSRFLHGAVKPSFRDFEQWILETNGGAIAPECFKRLRDALDGKPVASPAGSLDGVSGLTTEELAFWDEHGYVVLHDAVEAGPRDAAAAAIFAFLDADPDDPDTWYTNKHGKTIWVPLLHHPALCANRNAPRLVKAFSQLWGAEDLWPTIDQGGFNPPERSGWTFPGPHLHWDMTLATPHCFGVQGILYLTDTPADQGTFCCIPGFHRTLEAWLASLPPTANPRQAILGHPGLIPIAGKAGDLVLWHQALPHASSPNRGAHPRVVQYIYHRPTRWPYTEEWK
jgi:ectoine hydroxylase-related dioxygenase (phytanoyl-CoA dioxygenase family)